MKKVMAILLSASMLIGMSSAVYSDGVYDVFDPETEGFQLEKQYDYADCYDFLGLTITDEAYEVKQNLEQMKEKIKTAKDGVWITIVDQRGEPVQGLEIRAQKRSDLAKQTEDWSAPNVLEGYSDSDGCFYSLEKMNGEELRLSVAFKMDNGLDDVKYYKISPKKGKVNRYKIVWEDYYTVSYSKLEYTEGYSNLQSLLQGASTVVIAEVEKASADDSLSVVFTDYDINIKKVLKNEGNYDLEGIKVRFTGGKTKKEQTYILETPILKLGKTYVFAGNKTFSKDNNRKELTPMGAYQGVFELEKINGGEEEEIVSMNLYNGVEKGAVGMTISEIEKMISKRKESSTGVHDFYSEENDEADRRMKIEYTVSFDNIDEMLQEESLAVVGKVTNSWADDSEGIVFTHYPVEVQKVLKNPEQTNLEGIDFIFTGGKTEQQESVVLETPRLEKGKQYFFIATKTNPDDPNSKTYTPMGAYQGVFELESAVKPATGKEDYVIRPMNSRNVVEKDAVGTYLSDIGSMIS